MKTITFILLYSLTLNISRIRIETKSSPEHIKQRNKFFSGPQSPNHNDFNIPANPFKKSTFNKRNVEMSSTTHVHDFIVEEMLYEKKITRRTFSFQAKKPQVPKSFALSPKPTSKESFIVDVLRSYPNVHPDDVDILTRSNPFDVAENLDQVFKILKILNSHFHTKYRTIVSRAAVSPVSSTAKINDLIITPLAIPKHKIKIDRNIYFSLYTAISILNSLNKFDKMLPRIVFMSDESVDANLHLFNSFTKELSNLKKAFSNVSQIKNVKGYNYAHLASHFSKIIEQLNDISYKGMFVIVAQTSSGRDYARMLLKAKIENLLKINKDSYIWRATKIIVNVFKENQSINSKIALDTDLLKIKADKERFRKCDIFLESTYYKEGRDFVKEVDYMVKTMPTKNINFYYKDNLNEDNKRKLNKLYKDAYDSKEKKYFKFVKLFESYTKEINRIYGEILEASHAWGKIKLLLDMFDIIKTEEMYNRSMKFSTPKARSELGGKIKIKEENCK